MSFDDDFYPYKDHYGFVTPDGKESGNGLRYTSEYLIQRQLLFPNGYEASDFGFMVNQCEVRSGLLSRSPLSTELEAIDDYTAVASASSLLNPMVAKSILNWGDDHFGSYNNPDPLHFTPFSCLYRFPAFRPHPEVQLPRKAVHSLPGLVGDYALLQWVRISAAGPLGDVMAFSPCVREQ